MGSRPASLSPCPCCGLRAAGSCRVSRTGVSDLAARRGAAGRPDGGGRAAQAQRLLTPRPPLPRPPQIYPDSGHHFHSAPLRQHLYRSIINFFVGCFSVQDRVPTAAAKDEEED